MQAASLTAASQHPVALGPGIHAGRPSLAAIKARLVWESKKKEDLLDSQAAHEYYTELYGM
eukprot:6081611-Pleurochrysis_carterae.AAC.1